MSIKTVVRVFVHNQIVTPIAFYYEDGVLWSYSKLWGKSVGDKKYMYSLSYPSTQSAIELINHLNERFPNSCFELSRKLSAY